MNRRSSNQNRAGRKTAGPPRTVIRQNTYILPTRHGLLFLLVLAAMLAGSINYNNNLGFLLVFLLGGMTLVSIIHTHRNLVGLRILSIASRPVFAGQKAVFDLLVEAEGGPRRALVFSFKNKELSFTDDVDAGAVSRISLGVPAAERGIFSPGPLTVSTGYPLGLFRAWSVISDDLSCVVYPKPLAGPFLLREILQDRSAPPPGPGAIGKNGSDDFQGLKTYQPGDPVRQISWKAFSQGHGLFTKEFAGTDRTAPVFDYDQINEKDTEKALSRLCDMIIRAAAMNLEYGLRLPAALIPPGRGDRHRHRCLKALALFNKENAIK